MPSRPRCPAMLIAATLIGLAPGASAQFAFEPSAKVQTLNTPNGALTADIDVDGLMDVVSMQHNGISRELVVMRGLGNSQFDEVAGPPGSVVDRVHDIADLDGDGQLDVLFGGTEARVFYGQGGVAFGPGLDLIPALPSHDPTLDGDMMCAADIDGDGDQDVVLIDNPPLIFPVGLTLKLLINDGSGGFSLSQSLQPGNYVALDLCVGDLDHDGRLDILHLRPFSGLVDRWDGDAAGTWLAEPPVALPASAVAMELTDLDGDGNLDLLGVTDTRLFTRLGTGAGGFLAAVSRPVSPSFFALASDVRAADLDADGNPDATVSEFFGAGQGQLELVRGLGDGSFGPSLFLDLQPGESFFAQADFTGNNAVDVLTVEPGPAGDVHLHPQRSYAGTPWTDLGGALRGLAGWPSLLAAGSLLAGDRVQWDIADGAGPLFLVLGVTELGAPFKDGVMHPNPDAIQGPLALGASGDMSLQLTWPNVPGGFPLVLQAWMEDGSASAGFSSTGGLRGDVP